MKKVKVFLIVALIALLLGGCSQKITQGEVINKEFIAEHTEVRVIPVVTSNGKSTSTTLIPYVYHYPDTYKITIKDYDAEQKELTATYRVTKFVYDSIDYGDEFIFNKDYEPTEPEYTREKE